MLAIIQRGEEMGEFVWNREFVAEIGQHPKKRQMMAGNQGVSRRIAR
jgi:hypothetical protein